VITTKGVAQGPQYTLRIKEWKTDVAADACSESRSHLISSLQDENPRPKPGAGISSLISETNWGHGS
jgi:hypothetical protein